MRYGMTKRKELDVQVFELALFTNTKQLKGLELFIEYEEKSWHKNLSPVEKFYKLSEEIRALNLNIGDDFSCKKPYMILHK